MLDIVEDNNTIETYATLQYKLTEYTNLRAKDDFLTFVKIYASGS